MIFPAAYVKKHRLVFRKLCVIGHMVGIGAVAAEGNDRREGEPLRPFLFINSKEPVGAFLFCHTGMNPAGNPFHGPVIDGRGKAHGFDFLLILHCPQAVHQGRTVLKRQVGAKGHEG